MNENFLLEMRQVSAGYGKMTVIHDMSIALEEKSIVTLLGANGVGKTTILRTILGQTVLSSGQIFFFGEDISKKPTYFRATLGIGYCPEGRAVFGNLTCKENLQAGAFTLKDKRRYQENLDRVYSLFPILEERTNQLAESLSGGEQEMLAIGRALMSSPRLLLLDEPSLGLAPQLIQQIKETLKTINEQGVTVLLVEQNAHMALDLADYGYLIKKGSIAFEGTAMEIKDNEQVKDVYLGIM